MGPLTDLNVFEFNNIYELLNVHFNLKKIKNPKYSLRSYARQLGYKNPSLISDVLNQKRRPNSKLLKRISDQSKWTEQQLRYVEGLNLLNSIGKVNNKTEVVQKYLDSIQTKVNNNKIYLTLDIFNYISEWQHLVILELLELKDFKNDPNWISKKLNNLVSPEKVSITLERMERLKLIKKNKNNAKWIKTKKLPLWIGDTLPSLAIQNFHSQMIELGLQALKLKSQKERDIRGTTFSFEKSKMNIVTDLVKDFHEKLLLLNDSSQNDCVLQLNTQLFLLTNPSN